MTNTNPEAIRAIVTDVHTAVRNIHGVQHGDPLRKVQDAFSGHVGPDWRRELAQTLPAMAHTYQCVEMGWWLLHELEPGTPCTPPSLPDAEAREPGLPSMDDVLLLKDGTEARVLRRRYDDNDAPSIAGKWQVTGPEGARVVGLDEIASFKHAPNTSGLRAVVSGTGVRVEGPDGHQWFLSEFDLGGARALVNTGQAEAHHVVAVRAWDEQHAENTHAVARILNAAMNWEDALRAEAQPSGGLQAIERRLTAEDILRCEISAYMPLVAK